MDVGLWRSIELQQKIICQFKSSWLSKVINLYYNILMPQNKNTIIFLLLACLFIGTSENKSVIIKTHQYQNIKYGGVAGLFYPQFISIQQGDHQLKISVYNMTNDGNKTTKTNTIPKQKIFDCEFAMQTVDYGYYTQFAHYQIIADCFNSTHEQVQSIILYRSGDYKLISGNIKLRIPQQGNCNQGPLKVQYYYSSIGQPNTFVYRFCVKKQPQFQSLYKVFKFGSDATLVKQQSVQLTTGLKNMSLVDMQPALGVNGIFNVYLSQKYGLVVTTKNGNQVMWPIPGYQKVYKIQKLCWSNKLAILTQGFIYFVEVSFNQNKLNVNLLRKTQKINVASTSSCKFYTIGRFAICSTYNGKNTTVLIYSQDAKVIPTNITQVIQNQFVPYISEDLCSTNSFYFLNSRYQLYMLSNQSNQAQQKQLKRAGLKELDSNIVNYLDEGTLFTASLTPVNQTHQSLCYRGFLKSGQNPTIIRVNVVSRNISSVQFFYQNSASNLPIISSIFVDNNSRKTNIEIYLSNNRVNVNYTFYKTFILQTSATNIGYLRNLGNISQYFYALQTPIQKDAFARLTLVNSPELRYPYQFEAISYKICSVGAAQNQVLLYRQDPDALVVMRVGFRNKNFLVLDDIIKLDQYKQYKAQCAQDGILLYSKPKKSIVVLNNELRQKASHHLQFEQFKYTKQLLLISRGARVQVRNIISGSLIGQFGWALADIITNTYSRGFINKRQSAYYSFESKQPISQQVY